VADSYFRLQSDWEGLVKLSTDKDSSDVHTIKTASVGGFAPASYTSLSLSYSSSDLLTRVQWYQGVSLVSQISLSYIGSLLTNVARQV
jgi:hypothetical protein